DIAGLVDLAVAYLRGAGEPGSRRRAGDPVRGFAAQVRRVQPGTVVALVHVQHVAGDVLADDVPRRLFAPAHAAQVQAAALAEGGEGHGGVRADDATLRVVDLAVARREVARQEPAEVAFTDAADTGGILLGRSGQSGFGGQCPH